MSVHDFHGNIEILDNTFSHNMVFMPSAIYANYPKYNQTVFNPGFDYFVVKGNGTEKQDNDPVDSADAEHQVGEDELFGDTLVFRERGNSQ